MIRPGQPWAEGLGRTVRGSGKRSAAVLSAIAGLVLVSALAGCAARDQRGGGTAEDRTTECEQLYAIVDAAVVRGGVGDGGAAPVLDFPYLRVNRFLASLRKEAMSPAEEGWWVGRMRALDQRARSVELVNLPEQERERLALWLRGRGEATVLLQECGRVLVRRDLADRAAMARLRERARVPDDYQGWKRVVGIYPLTSLVFLQGVARYQAETRAAFSEAQSASLPEGRLVVYEPDVKSPARGESPSQILERSRDNPFGIPEPAEADLARLLALHAPLIAVDQMDGNDRIGVPAWGPYGIPRVDLSATKVFVRTSLARFSGEPLLQLVYSLWFPGRPKQGALDLLGGRLDGITWRVTLDRDGEPLIYDSIHNCGCYHMFFPSPRLRTRPRRAGLEEPVLVPARPGARRPGERILLSVAPATHYIRGVRYASDPAADERRRYSLAPDQELESLDAPGYGRRSLYRPDGIVPGSERGERYLFWPMGVREPGAMRQWGRHPTAFVGRRHFDDPDLIERYFERRRPECSRPG